MYSRILWGAVGRDSHLPVVSCFQLRFLLRPCLPSCFPQLLLQMYSFLLLSLNIVPHTSRFYWRFGSWGRATAWNMKYISNEIFVFIGLKLPAHSGPGNSRLLSCFFNSGSPSSLGVHSHGPFYLFLDALISRSPKSPSPHLLLESRSIFLPDYVVNLTLPFCMRAWSPPLLNLKMRLGIHLPCNECLSLLYYVKVLQSFLL